MNAEGEKKNIFGKKERNRNLTGVTKKVSDQDPSSAPSKSSKKVIRS